MLRKLLADLLGQFRSRRAPALSEQDIRQSYNLGNELALSGKHEQALQLMRDVVARNPHDAIALNELGHYLAQLGEASEALGYFEDSVRLDNSHASAVVNLASRLVYAYQSEAAEPHLQRAAALVPYSPHVSAIKAQIELRRGNATEACVHALEAWLKEFDNYSFAVVHLFTQCHPDESTDESIAAEHAFWNATRLRTSALTDLEPNASLRLPISPERIANICSGQERIRIGYISADFKQHSVSYFTLPLLENHDRSRFSVHVYHNAAVEDRISERIKSCVDSFKPVWRLNDKDFIKLIVDDDLDIVVDLSGHTEGTRISCFDQRLGRLHINALGYPPTTGLVGMDYKLLDRHVVAQGQASLYSEQPIAMNGTFWTFSPIDETPLPAAAPSTERGYVTFGYFGNITKITPRVAQAWAEILKSIPDAKLVVKSLQFRDLGSQKSLIEKLKRTGLTLDDFRLLPPDGPNELFDSYKEVDIILDSFPFGGGTTTCYALWMGVPVVTRKGKSLISSMGASMLAELGYSECIANSWDHYVEVAVALAKDQTTLKSIRSEMRERFRSSSLGDGAMFTRNFEQALTEQLLGERKANLRQNIKHSIARDQIMERARSVLNFGNAAGAKRILDYALQNYPRDGEMAMLDSLILQTQGNIQGAISALETAPHHPDLDTDIQLQMASLKYLSGNLTAAIGMTRDLGTASLDDSTRPQYELLKTAIDAHSHDNPTRQQCSPSETSIAKGKRIGVLSWTHPGLDRQLPLEFSDSNRPEGIEFEFHLLNAEEPLVAIENLLRHTNFDYVVLMGTYSRLLSPKNIPYCLAMLQDVDLIGPEGTLDTGRGTLNESDPLLNYGVWVESFQDETHTDHVVASHGNIPCSTLPGIQLLGNDALVFRTDLLSRVPWDDRLFCMAGYMEADWSIRVVQSGGKLAVWSGLSCMRHYVPRTEPSVWKENAMNYDCRTLFDQKWAPGQSRSSRFAKRRFALKLDSFERCQQILQEFSFRESSN